MDIYEDRIGYNGEKLWEFALKLLVLIKSKKQKLIISDLLIRELETHYSMEKINGMMKLFENELEKIFATKEQRDEAIKISNEREVPMGDALHAIIARDNNLILVTRDKHFLKLTDIAEYYKPEELI